jgi:cell division protein FtsI/penicillin-binding protein 2
VVKGFQPTYTDMHQVVADYWKTTYGVDYPGTLDQTLSLVQQGMRGAVTFEGGTALTAQTDYLPYVPIAGKTGTAEFCDNIAAALDQCIPGNWPSHAWFMGYAPYGNPEISVVAFIYNGGEGSIIAMPVAAEVMDAYFKLKTERALAAQQTPQAPTPQP